jgi:hypothetical protein
MLDETVIDAATVPVTLPDTLPLAVRLRSAERRVGKESGQACRTRWAT